MKNLTRAVIAGQSLFTVTWVVLGFIEGDGYSPIRHDESDLYAVTSRHLVTMEVVNAIVGIITITFALVVLRRVLAVDGRRGAFGPWFVAGSLVSLDCIAGVLFPLDCRMADAGCTVARATASFQGKMHYIEGIAAALMTAIAPFALAYRMRLLERWRDLARPAVIFGAVNLVLMAGFGVFQNAPVRGLFNKAPLLLGSIGVIVLARRVLELPPPAHRVRQTATATRVFRTKRSTSTTS